ncbi:VOC family protein [Streptococcus sp. NLN76]|uniref:SMU1112c/YaeR family gloxylase I-like metalloprotein n=1 Tax=Streptococcus sp. NLN76 TaxID=2822800 RepID=UPI0018A98C08|nr:VOC family protein [Streptococcus sp. NLN76]MBF8970504.1 VOC family protein [Streptococcus sp. NLN76]
MNFTGVDHIAIIGHDADRMLEFYVEHLGFSILEDHDRPEKEDRLILVEKNGLVLELFVKPRAPKRPALPHPEQTGLRHLAFKVEDVEATLDYFDQVGISHQGLRYDDFNQKKMAFFFDPDGLPLELHE